MIKKILFFFIIFPSLAFADDLSGGRIHSDFPPVGWKGQSSSDVVRPRTVIVADNSLQDNGDGSITYLPGGTHAPTTATYITQIPDVSLTNSQALSTLSTGLLKSTTGTGILSTALAGTDYLLTETDPLSIHLSVMTNLGDIIYGGALGTPLRLGIGTSTQPLFGGSTPNYRNFVESDLSLSNNSTNNATSVRHGFLPILSNNATQFLNGQGNFAIPAGVVNSYTTQAFSSATSDTVMHNFGAYPVVQILDSTNDVLIPNAITNNTLNDFTVTFTTPHTGTIIATVGSPQPQQVIVVNDTYTVATADMIIHQTAAFKSVHLPNATLNLGRVYIVDNASTGNATADSVVSGQLIEGQTTQILPPDSAMAVFSDGSEWRIF